MFKNALVSVSNKEGLIEFIKPLAAQGMRVVSTGGSAQHLRENGVKVVDVSEQTEFPEVMGGRVKTLHPIIHMAILARLGNAQDDALLQQYNLQAFDLVVCNLYPFEETLLKNPTAAELIEKIDIGGPTLLRASAKNHERIAVVCDPKDYRYIQSKNELNLEERRKLAAKVFSHVSGYDALIAKTLGASWGSEISFAGRESIELRYGENPHQKAKWYKNKGDNKGLHTAQILQGKPLSYNNLLDLDAAVHLVRQFHNPAAVAVKHNNPCGAAVDGDFFNALEKCLKSDPVSVFGGIVACNRPIEAKAAELLNTLFLECVVAPSVSEEAKTIFAKKKNLRILIWPEMLNTTEDLQIKSIAGGFLVQEADRFETRPEEWKYIGEKPNSEVLKDLVFAERVCASLKSNSIALVKNTSTLGLGMGQVNRVDAVEQAIQRLNNHHGSQKDVVMASDAFFPFADSVEKAARAGVKWVIQPGGSIKDEEVFAAAKNLNVNMVITGERHFRH